MNLVETVTDYLLQGVSVELVGRPASGRSHTLAAVAKNLAKLERPVVGLDGNSVLRSVPLACLVTSHPDVGRQPTLAEATIYLNDLLGKKGTLLLIDDSDDLDPVTSGVCASARARLRVPALIVRRLGPRPEGPQRAFVNALRPSVRIHMAPMNYAQVQSMITAELGNPADAKTLATISTKSGGLPGVARGMALVGRHTGNLYRKGDYWSSRSDLWLPELSQAMDALMQDADPEDISALSLLSFSGYTSVNDSRQIIDAGRIDRLAQLGFLDYVDGGDGGTVAIYPAILIDYFLNETTPPERVTIKERLVAAGLNLTHELSREEHPEAPEDPVLIARNVQAYWETQSQERLARWRKDPNPANAATLMMALVTQDQQVIDPYEVYSGTDLTVGDDADKVEMIAWYALYHAVVLGHLESSLTLLDDASLKYPTVATFCRAMQAHIRVMGDSMPEPLAAPADDELPRSMTFYLTVSAEMAAARGQFAEALKLLSQVTDSHLVFSAHGHIIESLCRVLTGDLLRGANEAQSLLDEALKTRLVGSIHAYSYVAALGFGMAGQVQQSDRLLAGSLVMTQTSAACMSYFAGLLGLEERVSRITFSGSVDDTQHPPLPPPEPHQRGPFPFMIPVLRSLDPADAEGAWAAVAELIAKGYMVQAAFLAADVAERHPDPAAFARATVDFEPSDSEMVNVIFELARATSQRSVDQLEAAYQRSVSAGGGLIAVRAGVQLALAHREQGERAAGHRAALATWKRKPELSVQMPGIFRQLARDVDISTREAEVAGLVASGLSSSEIAAKLSLSPRTVEYHLSAAYKKIGVDNRADLEAALSTWLAV